MLNVFTHDLTSYRPLWIDLGHHIEPVAHPVSIFFHETPDLDSRSCRRSLSSHRTRRARDGSKRVIAYVEKPKEVVQEYRPKRHVIQAQAYRNVAGSKT